MLRFSSATTWVSCSKITPMLFLSARWRIRSLFVLVSPSAFSCRILILLLVIASSMCNFLLEIELLRLADYESLLGSPHRGSQLDHYFILFCLYKTWMPSLYSLDNYPTFIFRQVCVLMLPSLFVVALVYLVYLLK